MVLIFNLVKTKSEENNLYKNFKKVTNIDGYLAVKQMKENKKTIKI